MPRPKKSADEKKTELVGTKFSPLGYEKLQTLCRASGIRSEAEVIRRLVDEVPLPSQEATAADPALITAINELTFQLSQVGNNVNQLTAANWQGRDFVRYWHEIGEETKPVIAEAKSLLMRLVETA